MTRDAAWTRPFRLATWNVNSVRARLEHVGSFIDEHRPDLLCLQETKVRDALFPTGFFEERGYRHHALRGQPNHHGVAIISREPFSDPHSTTFADIEEARHIGVTIAGVDIHNFYVPAGGDEPDPDINPRFAGKLAFVDHMTEWSRQRPRDSIMVGDLNIAPLETDVWSHKKLLNVISHTPIEVEKMEALRNAHPWIDAMRHFVPADEPLFTWWSYRAKDWRAANRGRRLDHIWVSPGLQGRLKAMKVIDAARDWPKPSDHAPVILDIDL